MDESLYRALARLEDHHWWFTARRRILARVVRHWVPIGSTVLDVGCGTGGLLSDLSNDYVVRGIDSSVRALEACRARGITEAVEGTAMDSSTWGPLPVDAVCLLDVIEHLDDDVATLRAARESLRPGGYVMTTVPAFQWLWSGHDTANHHRRRYSLGQLNQVHREAGLRRAYATYFNTLLFPAALAERLLSKAARRNGASAGLRAPPNLLNFSLHTIFSMESLPIESGRIRAPLGLSVLCVAQRLHETR